MAVISHVHAAEPQTLPPAHVRLQCLHDNVLCLVPDALAGLVSMAVCPGSPALRSVLRFHRGRGHTKLASGHFVSGGECHRKIEEASNARACARGGGGGAEGK